MRAIRGWWKIVRNSYFCWKVLVHLRLKILILEKFGGRVEISGNYDLDCWKFVAVDRKVVISCLDYVF